MLSPVRLALFGWFCRLMPETRAFRVKAACLRWCGAHVGANVRICSSATFLGKGHLEIGEDTWIGHQALICSSAVVKIGDCVDIGPQVYIGTGTHDLDPTGPHSAGQGVNRPIEIGDGAWLGARTMVLPGVTIGHKAVTAAGAVVTQDVPPLHLVGGVPARMIRPLVASGGQTS